MIDYESGAGAMVFAIPVDEVPQPRFDIGGWLIAEDFARSVNIGEGSRHVTGLDRLRPNVGFNIQ